MLNNIARQRHLRNPVRRRTALLLLTLVFLLIAGFRVAMLDRGALAYPDELRYFESVRAADRLASGRFTQFCASLSSTDARPGAALIDVIPGMLQRQLRLSHQLEVTDHRSLLIPLLFRVAITLALLGTFHRLSLIFFSGDRSLALLATVVYGLLANSNAYVRHLLPYDSALLLFLLALLAALSERARRMPLRFALIGLLTGAAWVTYPGYYAFPLIVFGAVALKESKSAGHWAPSWSTLSRLGACVAGFLVAPAAFEAVARIGGRSFIGDLRSLSGSIDQGSFEEGFTFIVKYFLQVETVIGVPLMLGVALFLFSGLFRLARNRNWSAPPRATLAMLMLPVLAAFLYHAFASAALHKMVFYARLVHMYAPFVVWCAVSAAMDLRPPALRRAAVVLLAVLSVASFIVFARGYYGLAYPRDVIREHADLISSIPMDNIRLVHESKSDPQHGNFSPYVSELARRRGPERSARSLVGVNLGFYYPLEPGDFTPYRPDPLESLIYDAPLWMGHPLCTFEGNTIEERRMFAERRYRVSLYLRESTEPEGP